MAESLQKQLLLEQKDIIALLTVLENNGLKKEKYEVETMVNYLDGMEHQLEQLFQRLDQIENTISNTKKPSLTERLEYGLKTVKHRVDTVRNNLIQGAHRAVDEFKVKGYAVLRKAIEAMKIPAALEHIKSTLHQVSKGLNKDIDKLDVMKEELNAANMHIKNVKTTLLGKEPIMETMVEEDKGILSKVQKLYKGVLNAFEKMEQRTDNTLAHLTNFLNREPKQSVRKQLKEIKGVQGTVIESRGKDQIR